MWPRCKLRASYPADSLNLDKIVRHLGTMIGWCQFNLRMTVAGRAFWMNIWMLWALKIVEDRLSTLEATRHLMESAQLALIFRGLLSMRHKGPILWRILLVDRFLLQENRLFPNNRKRSSWGPEKFRTIQQMLSDTPTAHRDLHSSNALTKSSRSKQNVRLYQPSKPDPSLRPNSQSQKLSVVNLIE